MSKPRPSSGAAIPPTPTGFAKIRHNLLHKRTNSSSSTVGSGSESSLTNRLNKAGSTMLSSSTSGAPVKKYKAPLSMEAKKGSTASPLRAQKSATSLAPPGTPTKSRDGSANGRRSPSRPRTPGTPRKGTGTGSDDQDAKSEMDVSNVDPERVLVDSHTVEPGDLSVELDEDGEWMKVRPTKEFGKEDKVMVSIRIRPSDDPSAWIADTATNSIKLDSAYTRNASLVSTSSTSSFTFDSILTGTPNKPVYVTTAQSHVRAAMEGYNALVFAYGQTASGKTFTLSGSDEEPGIIPRSMREVFGYIKRESSREYLLRCSYVEIYNETVIDLLAPPMMAKANPVQIQGGGSGSGGDVVLSPLREEVVTSLKGVREVLRRGERHRRTACTDWNERSSRSHSVFRLVVESRERGEDDGDGESAPSLGASTSGRQTPGMGGRQTPGLGGRQTPGMGGPRLQARGGRSVRTSVLSLIDLAGSEKATSDKDRTREGKYINTSLLTLGTVISALSSSSSSSSSTPHIPYRNSKLTRILQPSLSGNARISVVCTINAAPGAVGESMSTLLFAKRVKGVRLDARKREVVDRDALIERYRREIESLRERLREREGMGGGGGEGGEGKEGGKEGGGGGRRLSVKEQIDESKAMKELNNRIQQLTRLILTSNSVDLSGTGKDGESRPGSPVKVDFNMTPYQLQEELLNARLQIDSQATQILSLEASLLACPPLPSDAPEDDKDRLIMEQARTIRELEVVVRGYEESLGEPLRKVKEDVEREWGGRVEDERRRRVEKERWAEELGRELGREKKIRQMLEEERRALAAFVSKFDSLGLSSPSTTTTTTTFASIHAHSKLNPPMPTPGGAQTAYEARKSRSSLGSGGLASNYANSGGRSRLERIVDVPGGAGGTPDRVQVHANDAQAKEKETEEEMEEIGIDITGASTNLNLNLNLTPTHHDHDLAHRLNLNLGTQSSPLRITSRAFNQPSLMDQAFAFDMDEVNVSFDEVCEVERELLGLSAGVGGGGGGVKAKESRTDLKARAREVFGDKENVLPVPVIGSV